MSSLCVLLLVLYMTLSKAEVIQTFFEDSCGNESVLHSQSPTHTLQELSAIECGVQCAIDITCAAFSHPPCVLHSAAKSRTCSSHQAANHTFVKQVTISLYTVINSLKERERNASIIEFHRYFSSWIVHLFHCCRTAHTEQYS